MGAESLPDLRKRVVERFDRFVCPTDCGGSVVEVSENGGRVQICTMCHENAIECEFVTLGAADFDRLAGEVEQYRTAIKRALDTMAVANDEQLGPGGIARKAYAGLWHEYFAIPAGIPPTSEAPAPVPGDGQDERCWTIWPPVRLAGSEDVLAAIEGPLFTGDPVEVVPASERDEAVAYVNQRDEKLRELAGHIVDKIEYDTGRMEHDRPSGYVQVTWTQRDWDRIVALLRPHHDLAPASDEKENDGA